MDKVVEHVYVAYWSLGVSVLALLYIGVHGMLFEHYVRQQISLIPRLRYSYRHKCLYTQWVCAVCGGVMKQRLEDGLRDTEVLEVLLDDSRVRNVCKSCQEGCK